ncbi:MAG TPA: hypothetical protein VMJ75_11460 [Candidatus Acidoferrales bacterium]|nr:hypothetical protein [Candidatus Acidoferrales bacterium]
MTHIATGTRTEACNELEIVRILVWDHVAEQDTEVMYDVMQMVDRYHRLFGVPVFVLLVRLEVPAQPEHELLGALRLLDTRDLSFGDARIRKKRFLSRRRFCLSGCEPLYARGAGRDAYPTKTSVAVGGRQRARA